MHSNKKIGLCLISESIISLMIFIFVGVCKHNDVITSCWKSCVVDSVFFIVALILGVALMFYKAKDVSSYMAFFQMLVNIAIILISYCIIGICKVPTMICRKYTYPIVTFVITIAMIIDIFFLIKKGKK